MRLHHFVLLFFTMASFNCSTRDSSVPNREAFRTDTLYQIVTSLASENIIGDHIGVAGSTSRLDLFNRLNKIATQSELICLTDHQVPAVRYYAFRALTSRSDKKVFSILLNHMTDTMRINSFSGCSGMEETVVWNLVNLVTSKVSEPNGYKLTKDQLRIIDSIYRLHPDPIY